ncbi:hypothetical protein CDIK_3224 [Cucumispora dikerogammari]|nr:hypothetical protein CDIK_3224 [Cucumispora dikerogammari]
MLTSEIVILYSFQDFVLSFIFLNNYKYARCQEELIINETQIQIKEDEISIENYKHTEQDTSFIINQDVWLSNPPAYSINTSSLKHCSSFLEYDSESEYNECFLQYIASDTIYTSECERDISSCFQETKEEHMNFININDIFDSLEETCISSNDDNFVLETCKNNVSSCDSISNDVINSSIDSTVTTLSCEKVSGLLNSSIKKIENIGKEFQISSVEGLIPDNKIKPFVTTSKIKRRAIGVESKTEETFEEGVDVINKYPKSLSPINAYIDLVSSDNKATDSNKTTTQNLNNIVVTNGGSLSEYCCNLNQQRSSMSSQLNEYAEKSNEVNNKKLTTYSKTSLIKKSNIISSRLEARNSDINCNITCKNNEPSENCQYVNIMGEFFPCKLQMVPHISQENENETVIIYYRKAASTEHFDFDTSFDKKRVFFPKLKINIEKEKIESEKKHIRIKIFDIPIFLQAVFYNLPNNCTASENIYEQSKMPFSRNSLIDITVSLKSDIKVIEIIPKLIFSSGMCFFSKQFYTRKVYECMYYEEAGADIPTTKDCFNNVKHSVSGTNKSQEIRYLRKRISTVLKRVSMIKNDKGFEPSSQHILEIITKLINLDSHLKEMSWKLFPVVEIKQAIIKIYNFNIAFMSDSLKLTSYKGKNCVERSLTNAYKSVYRKLKTLTIYIINLYHDYLKEDCEPILYI